MKYTTAINTYSRAQVVYFLFIFLGAVFALKLSEFSIYLFGFILLYAAFHRKLELPYLLLMLLSSLSVINEVLVTKGFNFYLVTRGTLFVLAMIMTIRRGGKKDVWYMSPFYWLFFYVLYMMVVSLQGWAPMISELKAVLFIVFLTALTQTVSAANQSGFDIRHIRAGLLAVASFYIFGSIAVLPFPEIGRSMVIQFNLTEAKGLYNGLTWHSQTLGPLIALMNALLLTDYLCNLKKRDWLYLSLFAAIPILVYLSSSRTAFLGYLLSILSALFFFSREKQITQAKKSKALVGIVGLFMLAGVFIIAKPGVFLQLEAFLRKTSDVQTMDTGSSLTESLTKSRMGLVEMGIYNFKQSPWIGNGFQVSEEMQALDGGSTGLILTAPIEKGVLPVMVLEEGGIIGAFIFLAFIISVYAKFMRLRFTCFLSTFSTFLMLNSGEATFFSTSGTGGVLWMFCFTGLLMDIYRYRNTLQVRMLKLDGSIPYFEMKVR